MESTTRKTVTPVMARPANSSDQPAALVSGSDNRRAGHGEGGRSARGVSAAGARGAGVCNNHRTPCNKNIHPGSHANTLRTGEQRTRILQVVRVRPPIAKQRKSALSTSKALHARLKKIIGIKRSRGHAIHAGRGRGGGGGGALRLSRPATWKALAPRMSAGRCLVSGCGWARSRASVRD